MAKIERRAIDRVFILLGTAMVGVLVVIGGLAWYGYDFATNNVKTELSQQRVFFPAAGSPAIAALPESDQKEINKYAGQQLVDGEQAKVYANHYINAHLKEIADGKTYAEVSTEALKNPTDAKLQGQKAALFQGETLRGLLLGSGYAYWTFGMIAKFAAIAAFVGAAVMTVLVLLGLRHVTKIK